MTDLIVLAVIVIVLGLAVGYIVKAKKSGVKCIGCPSGGTCAHGGCSCDGGENAGCGCCGKEE